MRLAAGLSQGELAQIAGISRQAYSSIESGRSVPSTEISLKLAQALKASVEMLFSLREDLADTIEAHLVPGVGPTNEHSRVQLYSVADKILARPLVGRNSTSYVIPPADGINMSPTSSNRVSVQLISPINTFEQLILVGGDPSVTLFGQELRKNGYDLVWLGEDSQKALTYLSMGAAHIAGCHLFDEHSGDYNVTWVKKLVPFPCSIINFAVREQGFIVANNNPKGITNIDDLERNDITFINREEGSGSRALLDSLIEKSGTNPNYINGYQRSLDGHLAIAEAVSVGLADMGVGVKSIAKAKGLGFVPLSKERYDFVVPNHFLDIPTVQVFLQCLKLPYYRRQIEMLGGYDIALMGNPVN